MALDFYLEQYSLRMAQQDADGLFSYIYFYCVRIKSHQVT